MLDVVLYRIDTFGRIDLSESTFRTLRQLARYFTTDAGQLWDWVEITTPDRFSPTRYSADDLRKMDESWRTDKGPATA